VIVPFVMTLLTKDNHPYLWCFNLFLEMAAKKGWPIIAQDEYFVKPSELIREAPSLYNSEYVDRCFGYAVPVDDDLLKIQQYPIEESFTEDLVKRHSGSRNGALCSLMSERNQEFEILIEGYIKDIEKNNPEKIEAVITLSWFPSLEAVCQKHGIRVIQFEHGPFREPAYRKTAMYRYSSLYGEQNELQGRYESFLLEMDAKQQSLLTRKQILSLFLQPEKQCYLDRFDTPAEYPMGVATGWAITPFFLMQDYCTDQDMLFQLSKQYDINNDVLVRLHPGDNARASYPNYVKSIDRSTDSVKFIQRCERVVSLGSNVSMEAAFWGKTPYTLLKSPSYYNTLHDLSYKQKHTVDLSYLNFYAFCYLLPWELINNCDYLSWRLSDPSELEIFNYHLDYYLRDKEIGRVLLGAGEEDMLKVLRDKAELALLSNIEELRPAAIAYYEVINSTSWKVTAPLRKLASFLRREQR
jgi:hypothetical protein